ncbi:LysM domain-containing protein [Pedococcus dokdonensis]|uniref:LysM domain-containing protein n=1 Tax=Pedococcus dokdonensis TaxID=443156 RepID=A0A1H0U4K4_9MICO|nr:LysM peptidoglycan-binding domain-containing protein [Pedococcus dokdonensis]SDP61071.1 LysM domain-containing protein [Pedococcus dokdonensis]
MTLRTRLTGLIAALTIVAIVIALPITLLAVGANPLPDTWPTLDQARTALTSPDDGTLALGALRVLGWAAWLFLTGSIALEILARARGVRAPRLPGLHAPQAAAAGLVGAAILLFVTAPLTGTPAQAAPMTTHVTTQTVTNAAARAATPVTGADQGSPTPEPARATPSHTHATTARPDPATVEHVVERGETLWSLAERYLGAGIRYTELADLNRDVLGPNPGFLTVGQVLQVPTGESSTGAQSDTQMAGHVVTVRRGDTLSQIAQEQLGNGDKYPEIFEASKDAVQPDGRHLSDPDLILPGWKLSIPAMKAAASETPGPHREQTGTEHPRPGSSEPAAPAQPTPRAAAPQAAPESPTTPRADAPTVQQPEPTPAATSGDTHDDADPRHGAWMLAGLTGGGAMLAGAMLLALRGRRKAQFRARRPGRTIAAPEPLLAPVEKTLTAAGGPASVDVEVMDEALRRLAAATAASTAPMPELAAVELAQRALTLHLSTPTTLEGPWVGSADQLHWTLPAGADLRDIGPLTPDQPAPYPLLVTIGAGDDGSVWMLNIEDLDLSITGDATFGRDFARYLAAEIACNPWSHGVRVDLVGVAHEVADMNTDRIRVHTGGEPDPAAEALADAITMIDRSAEADADIATARARQDGADAWPARLLLVDANEGIEASPGESAARELPPALEQLLQTVYRHPGQTGTCVVVRGEREGTPGLVLRVTGNGRVSLPHAGLDLIAVGLTRDEAQGCAALLAQSEDLSDAPVPVDQHARDGWRAWSDEAGALREEHTTARHAPADEDARAGSLLQHDDQDYLRKGATTRDDLETLAPKVPQRVRDAVADADPTLGDDLAMWWSQDCPLPRLTLLGPVAARTRGTPVTKRKPYYTEMLAYLATRAHGATPEELADAFSITPAKARDYVRIVRDWLGTNPRTGQAHLPDARKAPAAIARGVGVYEVLDLLVDADLFRRLRVRGESRGPDGVDDLRKALRLVQGRPFDRLRDGGWSFLSEGDRLDQHMVCAIVDVAHLVTTYSLQAGDTRQARLAAETAAIAAPDEEIPRLDLAAVADAEGHPREAERILRDEVCNRTDDECAPPELSDRTKRVIATREWHERTRKAG